MCKYDASGQARELALKAGVQRGPFHSSMGEGLIIIVQAWLDYITFPLISLPPRLPPSLYLHPLFGSSVERGAALMMHADRFIPRCPPIASPSALKCAQVSGSSSEVTLFIYAKLAHLWNGAFKASDIKGSKAGPIKSEQGLALHYNKLKQLCES